LVVIMASLILYITSLFRNGIITKPWRYMALAFFFFTISDLLFSYLSWLDKYGNGNLIDVGWNLGYLLAGLAGVYQITLLNSMKEGRTTNE
jgi:hypothetical protein